MNLAEKLSNLINSDKSSWIVALASALPSKNNNAEMLVHLQVYNGINKERVSLTPTLTFTPAYCKNF